MPTGTGLRLWQWNWGEENPHPQPLHKPTPPTLTLLLTSAEIFEKDLPTTTITTTFGSTEAPWAVAAQLSPCYPLKVRKQVHCPWITEDKGNAATHWAKVTEDPVAHLLGVVCEESIGSKALRRRRTNMRCLIVGDWLTEPIWPLPLYRWTLQSCGAHPSAKAPEISLKYQHKLEQKVH